MDGGLFLHGVEFAFWRMIPLSMITTCPKRISTTLICVRKFSLISVGAFIVVLDFARSALGHRLGLDDHSMYNSHLLVSAIRLDNA
jgi:hypothetical protein